ncbi:hypothetical protein FJ364_02040 [Candidatus Dependentiae bacterium]|nr:hypothetical protein [Candidatus Dependentiae bacterium]
MNGNIEVIRFLVEEVCVDISVKDNAGRTAEELAIHINSSALDDEHQRCRFEMIRILNAAVNSISSRQRPLYTIYSELLVNSYRGDLQKVEALIGELKNCNADINLALKQTNGIGYSPLRLAVNEDHTDVVRFLTDIWPDIEGDFNSEARDFLTPLHQAVDARNVEIVEILICALQRLNRDINTPNNEGVTLLELAACNGCVEVVQILVAAMSDRNEDINMINHKGDTLLHAVVRSCENPVIDRVLGWRRSISNKIRVIDFLVNNGVDVFIKNRDGETAAERAVRCLRGMLEEAEYDQLLIVLLASFPVVMK